MQDTIECNRLDRAPMPGPLGKIIQDHIFEEQWQEWLELEIKIINEERLDLSEESARQRLFQAMIDFLNLDAHL